MADKEHDQDIEKAFYGTVTVGERGQVVIPAEARSDMDVEAGEKLLVFGHPSQQGLMLVRVSQMADFIEFMESALETATAAEQDESRENSQ